MGVLVLSTSSVSLLIVFAEVQLLAVCCPGQQYTVVCIMSAVLTILCQRSAGLVSRRPALGRLRDSVVLVLLYGTPAVYGMSGVGMLWYQGRAVTSAWLAASPVLAAVLSVIYASFGIRVAALLLALLLGCVLTSTTALDLLPLSAAC